MISEQEPYFYLKEEVNQAIVYTEDDANICDLNCQIMEKCRLGLVPETSSIDEV